MDRLTRRRRGRDSTAAGGRGRYAPLAGKRRRNTESLRRLRILDGRLRRSRWRRRARSGRCWHSTRGIHTRVLSSIRQGRGNGEPWPGRRRRRVSGWCWFGLGFAGAPRCRGWWRSRSPFRSRRCWGCGRCRNGFGNRPRRDCWRRGRRRRRSQSCSRPIDRRRGRRRRGGNCLLGLSCLLLLEEVDNEVLVFTDKVVGQALGRQVFSKVLPPLRVKGIKFGKRRGCCCRCRRLLVIPIHAPRPVIPCWRGYPRRFRRCGG